MNNKINRGGLEERILSHDKQLVRIDTILERVAQNQDRMNSTVEKLATAMNQLVANQDTNVKGFERVHERIDEAIVLIKEAKDKAKEADTNSQGRKNEVDEKLKKIEFIFIIAKYPRFFVLSLIGMYVIAGTDFLSILFKLIP